MAKQCCSRSQDGNRHPNGVIDLVDPVDTICVFVEGGVVQNVTGIPHGTKLLVLDYDCEGSEENTLSKVLLEKDSEPEEVCMQVHNYEGREGNGFTLKQREEYLNNPNTCPFCESTDIQGDSIDADYGSASQPISCVSCGKQWNDIYRLVDVELRG